MIRQAKILLDEERTGPDGAPRSKGIGFVEFGEHEHALCALRQLNNNPDAFSKVRRRAGGMGRRRGRGWDSAETQRRSCACSLLWRAARRQDSMPYCIALHHLEADRRGGRAPPLPAGEAPNR